MFRSTPVAAVIALAVGGVAVAQPAVSPAVLAFKELSEAAFSAPNPALDQAIARAKAQLAATKPPLPPAVARDVSGQLSKLDAARKAGDRQGVSLAAAEVYRTLVEVAPSSGKVPPEVRLIDYARLRYAADMQAGPPRWDDARDAATFARARWAAIVPQVNAGALRLEMEQAINEMDSAAGDRDGIRGEQAVARLADLTQKLEAYFVAL